jgi:hypothetical protein
VTTRADSPPLDSRTVDLLQTVARVMASQSKIKYAIGGGIAVISHGVMRNTADVDVFIGTTKQAAKAALFRALMDAGLIIEEVYPPAHYFAFRLSHGDPRIRVDLLFTNDPLELDAVRESERGGMWGVDFNVFPPALLAAIKWNTDETRHRMDVGLMLDRGVVTPAAVHQELESVDEDEAARFVRYVTQRRRDAQKPKRNPWPRKSRS